MMDLITYIKELISFGTRKRRAADDFENPVGTKIRRVSSSQMSTPEDDWVSTSSSNSIRRRSGLFDKRDTTKHKCSWLKDKSPISLDDDDDIIEVRKPSDSFEFMRKSAKHTSTPNGNQTTQNGDDEVTFVKYTDSPAVKQLNAKKRGFEYIKPSAYFLDPQKGIASRLQNGTRKRESTSVFGGLRDTKQKNFPMGRRLMRLNSPALDQSFRLDEKRKYKELLKTIPSSSTKSLLNVFAEYSTPVNRLFNYGTMSRGKKMVELARAGNCKKAPGIIDLTDTSSVKNKDKVHLSTRDTIKKVLNEYDNEVVVVKDSDSEVEVLPTPPSPKADITVEKCNSLKTLVDRSEPVHDQWFSNLSVPYATKINKYNEEYEIRQRQIEEQKSNVQKCKGVAEEIRTKLLVDKVSKCLHIKEVLLPYEEERTSVFPSLSAKQDAIIDSALDKSKSATEILSSKFNMNITRQDMLTLAGLNWLNDEVINFYMNLIIERGTGGKLPSVYAFNTFFYPKILSSGQSSVRRWTRRIDIFSRDILVVPIHLRMHWCMAIVDLRKKKISYYDSMGSSNKLCLETLLKYLQDEHVDKKKSDLDVSDWRLVNMKNIPQQMNGSDCGMFSCTFAEVLSRDAEITFGQEDMPYLRRKMVIEILQGRLLIS